MRVRESSQMWQTGAARNDAHKRSQFCSQTNVVSDGGFTTSGIVLSLPRHSFVFDWFIPVWLWWRRSSSSIHGLRCPQDCGLYCKAPVLIHTFIFNWLTSLNVQFSQPRKALPQCRWDTNKTDTVLIVSSSLCWSINQCVNVHRAVSLNKKILVLKRTALFGLDVWHRYQTWCKNYSSPVVEWLWAFLSRQYFLLLFFTSY